MGPPPDLGGPTQPHLTGQQDSLPNRGACKQAGQSQPRLDVRLVPRRVQRGAGDTRTGLVPGVLAFGDVERAGGRGRTEVSPELWLWSGVEVEVAGAAPGSASAHCLEVGFLLH